jgi:predicted metalloprotease with PDZ domain
VNECLWSSRATVRGAVLCVMLAFVACSARATIQYEVSLEHPEQHLFHVTMTIPNVAGNVDVQIPAWNALYQIRDFSSHIEKVAATASDTTVAIEKVDKQTWHVKGTGTVQIRYTTEWDENGPFATQLNAEHAFINAAMILMYVPERRPEAIGVTFKDIPADWALATASQRSILQAGNVRMISILSPSYDELVDGPIELGKFQQFD